MNREQMQKVGDKVITLIQSYINSRIGLIHANYQRLAAEYAQLDAHRIQLEQRVAALQACQQRTDAAMLLLVERVRAFAKEIE